MRSRTVIKQIRACQTRKSDFLAHDPGDHEVRQALQACAYFLVVLSRATSENVLNEIELACANGKYIIPVQCEECEIPLRLQRTQRVDLWPGYEKGLKHIIEALDLPNGAQRPSDHPRIAPDHPAEILTCRPKGLEATAKRTAEGFWVLAGSQALMQDRPSIAAGTLRHRQELLADGSMIAKDEALVFTRDTRFDSPSAAAAVIYGGNMNGLETWVMKDGRTLKHYGSVGLEETSFAAGHGK